VRVDACLKSCRWIDVAADDVYAVAAEPVIADIG
jgi:hypothetical protein